MLSQGNKRKPRTTHLQGMPGSTIYKDKTTQVKTGILRIFPRDGDATEYIKKFLTGDTKQLRLPGVKRERIIRSQTLHIAQQKLLFRTYQEYGKGFGTELQKTTSPFRSAIFLQHQDLLFHDKSLIPSESFAGMSSGQNRGMGPPARIFSPCHPGTGASRLSLDQVCLVLQNSIGRGGSTLPLPENSEKSFRRPAQKGLTF